MDLLTAGGIAMGYGVAALFFLRFWRDTRDRLFAFFAIAFAVLAANRVGFAVYGRHPELGDHTYWVRFAAFAVILLAIVDKNRPGPSGSPPRGDAVRAGPPTRAPAPGRPGPPA